MDVIELGGSGPPRRPRWLAPALIVTMAAAVGVWLGLSSFNEHSSASGVPAPSALSTGASAVLRPVVGPTMTDMFDVTASLNAGRAALPPRRGGQIAAFETDAGQMTGYGTPALKPGPFLLDVVCVGYGSVQVEVDDSRGQMLARPLVLSCETEVSSDDPGSISFRAPGGGITVMVGDLSNSPSVVAFDVSPQAG